MGIMDGTDADFMEECQREILEEGRNSPDTKEDLQNGTQQLRDSISLLKEAVDKEGDDYIKCVCNSVWLLRKKECWHCRALEQIANLESI